MQTYRIETVIAEDRELTIRNLPFRSGEKVEVIILSKTGNSAAKKSYSLRGKPVRYVEPFAPVAEDDWDSLK